MLNRNRLVFGIAFLGILVAARSQAQEGQTGGTVNQELQEMYQADQADRQDLSEIWKTGKQPSQERLKGMMERDSKRLQRVKEIVRAGELQAAEDYFHAAMILQHGEEPADFLLSHVLATAAGFKGHESGRWLSAASLDRYLHRTDQPQVFGTQSRLHEGVWSKDPFNSDLLTNAVRQEYGVPPVE